ncbi:transmembrane sensor [Pseudomonas aeruginosa]|nr:transmembrane sensor [Pseudomonas aeruginosa]
MVLADGSKLFLDVDTQVQVRYAERTRDVLLKKGEVFFVVSHDPARPFRVGSGDSRVTGTRVPSSASGATRRPSPWR